MIRKQEHRGLAQLFSDLAQAAVVVKKSMFPNEQALKEKGHRLEAGLRLQGQGSYGHRLPSPGGEQA